LASSLPGPVRKGLGAVTMAAARPDRDAGYQAANKQRKKERNALLAQSAD
jgi:hypothetical protein